MAEEFALPRGHYSGEIEKRIDDLRTQEAIDELRARRARRASEERRRRMAHHPSMSGQPIKKPGEVGGVTVHPRHGGAQ